MTSETTTPKQSSQRWLLACIALTLISGIGGYFLGLHHGRSEAIEGGAEAVASTVQQKLSQDPAASQAADLAMSREKTQRARVQSAQRLSDIGKAMKSYNLAHPDGPLPKSLEDLARDQHIGNAMLVSPVTGKKLAFIPQPPNTPASKLMGYDALLPDGGNVLYADGHVEWEVGSEFKRNVEKGGDLSFVLCPWQLLVPSVLHRDHDSFAGVVGQDCDEGLVLSSGHVGGVFGDAKRVAGLELDPLVSAAVFAGARQHVQDLG